MMRLVAFVGFVGLAAAALPGFFAGHNVRHHEANRTTTITPSGRPTARNIPELKTRLLLNRELLRSTRYGSHVSRKLNPDDYFKFIPTHIGNILPGSTIRWDRTSASNLCFQKATATFSLNAASRQATLMVTYSDKVSFSCADLFLFAGVDTYHVHDFLIDGKDTFIWSDLTDVALKDLAHNGLRVLHFPDAVLGDIVDVYETALLFFRAFIDGAVGGSPKVPAEDEAMNVQFLADHQGNRMKPRTAGDIGYNASMVQSGDFLGIIRLDGLDPMIAWGEGAHTGHTVSCLEIDGVMYVVESQTQSPYWPKAHIQRHEFGEWLALAKKASYNVVHVPLSKAARTKWNNTAAVEFFLAHEGVPYGFNNFLFGWIDSPEGNFPPPLQAQTVMVLFAIAQSVMPAETETFWNQALNRRLGTDGLNCFEAYAAADARGIKFGDLITMPEQDHWLYHQPAGNGWNGTTPMRAMVCNVFVCNLIRAGGVMEFGDQINCAETTNWDVYSLDCFDPAPVRPAICVKADPNNKHCQILGDYELQLTGAGTVAPYPHMREHCAGVAPEYYWANLTC